MIKSKLEFRIGSRLVSQRDFFKDIERQVVEKAKKSIIRTVKAVTDPSTGKPPMIRAVPGRPLDLEISGSKESIDRVKAELRS